MRKDLDAAIGWWGLLAYVIVFDTLLICGRKDTMSTAARRHPISTGITAALLSAHLTHQFAFDPLATASRKLGRVLNPANWSV